MRSTVPMDDDEFEDDAEVEAALEELWQQSRDRTIG